jgi:hypothetical protein
MIKESSKIFFAILLIMMNLGYCNEQNNSINANPFPIAEIDPEILDYFYPMVMEEINKEFAHQNDSRTHRDTREYGYSFFQMENGDFNYTPPPEFLNALGNEICHAFGHPSKEFTNIILSFYDEGFHLKPHIDTNSSSPHREYYFDEKVYGIIIEADPNGHLYFIRDDVNTIPPLDCDPIYSLDEKPGTIFCLQGLYRRAPYFHGVSKVSNRRISITFRKVIIERN